MKRFLVRKVAVLGAGVMGAQIAAHLVNCNVPVVLFDLPAKEGPKNGIAQKAIDNLKKIKPAPLGVAEDAARITAANYEEHLGLLTECDLVIEAIVEKAADKQALIASLENIVSRRTIIASNTSAIPVTLLQSKARYPDRIVGLHWAEPAHITRFMEIIGGKQTTAATRRRARREAPLTSAQRSTGATSLTPGRATTRRTGASEASPSWACAQSGSRSTPAWNSRRSAGSSVSSVVIGPGISPVRGVSRTTCEAATTSPMA